jgi:type 1 glutamine amidotransferase
MAALAQCNPTQQNQQHSEKIKLLILTGRNNHEWAKTTPQLVKMYEECYRFQVELTHSPDTMTFESFKEFDVVVSNWSAWPEHDYRWPEKTEEGLLKYIERGGGFVLFHAAAATFYDWPKYQELVGSTWGDSTRHGKIAPHKIVITDQKHPVTEGISDFWITDELWVNAGVNSGLNVLATSWSDPENAGRNENEPVIHVKEFGQGRVFHNVLGHNVRAMKNTGWKTLMLRGTEWAATGTVTISVPNALLANDLQKSARFSWDETDTTVALLNYGELVWQYNFNTIKGKPFFHPVNIEQSTLTWLSPEDHPWHLGIWHSWKYINGVNYWEYDRSEGVAPFNFLGITEVRNIKIEKSADFSCRFMLDIFYHEKGGPDLMKEQRIVCVSSPDDDGQFMISYQMELVALADHVELNRTPLPNEENGQSWGGYAGLSVRFSQDLFEPSFINPTGSREMAHGTSMPWKYYGLRDIQGKQVGVAIFTGEENLSYPEPWFVTDYEDHPFYYFSPAPIFNAQKVLQKGEELTFGYRIQFYQGAVNVDQLESGYANYINESKTQ